MFEELTKSMKKYLFKNIHNKTIQFNLKQRVDLFNNVIVSEEAGESGQNF